MLALAISSQASAQPRISNDTVKIGVLTDMSSLYADNGGPGSVAAAQMAVDDFGGNVLGKKIEVVSADNLNKADVGASIARRWIDTEGVDVIVDVPNSAVALAVQEITRNKNKVFLATGTASSRLTADVCSPTTVHWTYDTYALAHGTGQAVVETGGDTWFFIAADFAVGAALQGDTTAVINAKRRQGARRGASSDQLAGFRVLSAAGAGLQGQDHRPRHRRRRHDQLWSSRAPSSASARAARSWRRCWSSSPTSIRWALQKAQGLMLTAAFYWDLNDKTRAWSKKFAERYPKVPDDDPCRHLWRGDALPEGGRRRRHR